VLKTPLAFQISMIEYGFQRRGNNFEPEALLRRLGQ
jgi:hypothetical protein